MTPTLRTAKPARRSSNSSAPRRERAQRIAAREAATGHLQRASAARTPLIARPLVAVLDSAVKAQIQRDPFGRSPSFIAGMMPWIRAINRYFDVEIRGWHHVPARGPFLMVANHSGGPETNDLTFLLGKWLETRGPEAPLYALGYNLIFTLPAMAEQLRRYGIIPANQANALKALRRGAGVVVFPGGDHEVFRPWNERNRIDFGGRTGFITLAIRAGVPVVPVTIHGAHESTFVLTRGRRIARWFGFDRLRVHVFPLRWSIPFGLTPAYVPSLHLPAKVTLQVSEPLDWTHIPRRRARDRRVVRRCYDEIIGVMQAEMDALAAERPYPLLERLRALGRSVVSMV